MKDFREVLEDVLAEVTIMPGPTRRGPKGTPIKDILRDLALMVRAGDTVRERAEVSKAHYNTLSGSMGREDLPTLITLALIKAEIRRWGRLKSKTTAAKRNEYLLRSLCVTIDSIVEAGK